MTEFSPNPEQQELIDSHEGIHKVDAGAGTGKTFAVTLRYAEILEQKDVKPEDLLLLTFTNNAADEMKERIINECSYNTRELRDAPISTFHSLAKKIVNENGFQIPKLIGIDDSIATSTRLIESEVLERQKFQEFINSFILENPEYRKEYRTLYNYSELLNLIKSLASKGVIPAKKGWYQNTGEELEGDFDEYWKRVKKLNETDGSKSSDLRERTGGVFKKCLIEDAPTNQDVRGQPYIDKQVNIEYFEQAFNEDREQLKQFVHDLYFGYIEYCLSNNFLNFNFLLIFAYILLCENESVRERLKYRYTMIDEFQDTNEIQLKIGMLLSQGNICVVGDWKQSIYSFQYAEVENIRKFDDRLKRYKKQLNSDKIRVKYSVDEINEIHLKQNYRSAEQILDFSETSLILPGKDDETLDAEKILNKVTSLESNNDGGSSIEAFQSDEEVEAVLHKIQRTVDNENYLNKEGEKLGYEDIAVLTRNRKFGLKLQEKAREYGIPVAYEGGVELFTTKPSILLLAWLRILNYKNSKKGWAVILEEAGYSIEEIKYITRNRDYPENMVEFRTKLEKENYISGVSRTVFQRYGIENSFSDKVTEVLQNVFDSSYMNTGNLIRFIEESIEDGATHEVDGSTEKGVTIQTIHSAKGLEYPAVFIADINQDRFPSTSSNSSVITYNDLLGLRQKKIYSSERQYVFENWKAHLAAKVTDRSYDEERRLMYVAMTRAENHLFLSSTEEKPSKFFENLEIEKTIIQPEIKKVEIERNKKKELNVDSPENKAAIKRSVHDIMNLKENTEGRGPKFGTQVHKFAEKYAKGEDIKPCNSDEENVKEFIDSLKGELRPEVPIQVPVQENDRKVIYNGVVDLLHITEDKVEIIDWKTDLTRVNQEEYEKQLEIYKRGIGEIYDKGIESRITWTTNL